MVPIPALKRGVVAVGRLVCLAAALAIIFAAATKLVDLPAFAATLGDQHGREGDALGTLATALAGAEAGVGALALGLTIRGRWTRAGLVLGAVFLAFAGYPVWLSVHPPPRPASCGCGFSTRAVAPDEWSGLALRNASIAGGLALLAVVGARAPGGRA